MRTVSVALWIAAAVIIVRSMRFGATPSAAWSTRFIGLVALLFGARSWYRSDTLYDKDRLLQVHGEDDDQDRPRGVSDS